MSAQADPPVQKETEETGGDSQPDVTISSHNSMGNLDPALRYKAIWRFGAI